MSDQYDGPDQVCYLTLISSLLLCRVLCRVKSTHDVIKDVIALGEFLNIDEIFDSTKIKSVISLGRHLFRINIKKWSLVIESMLIAHFSLNCSDFAVACRRRFQIPLPNLKCITVCLNVTIVGINYFG